ncbi:hypothetical protein BOX15_Mlig007117g2 [Macrostomum lignano]|uniref:VTT domain-containing protein n=1 Tax=Macrostomum lignano TaxID=282301 RepID=A0A267HA37_9PLAT|nr:hypothetical protein BOX15_Mlig007117g2 [Macrostomum lignano]
MPKSSKPNSVESNAKDNNKKVNSESIVGGEAISDSTTSYSSSRRRTFGVTPRDPIHSEPADEANSSAAASAAYVYRKGDTRRAVLWLGAIFSIALLLMYIVYLSMPPFTAEESQLLRLPSTLDDAKQLGNLLYKYKSTYFAQVLIGLAITYVFLQTFAIPGSIFLSILSGYLFPLPLALTLVCTCSAIGASFCYLLSYLALRPLLHKYVANRISSWATEVAKHREHLFNYIMFLRITPFLPNWFINLASPIVGVSLVPFFIGTFFGVMPPSVFAIQGGQTLQKLASTSETVTWRSVSILAVLALLAIAPAVFKNRLKQRLKF